MTYPPWGEVFNKPSMSTCAVECPPAWRGDSPAVQFADMECARLIVNAMFQPPITNAREFRLALREAELENRRRRSDD